ncbi:MAG: TatD family hydrolase [Prevotellaceae bacterium]|jgi:TatD DNase family protein|nr:TatD family hydrolase [Prevotellaceae bacterium]
MYDYLIDTHTHLFSEEFKDDISRVVGRAEAAGVKQFVLPAIDSGSFNDMMELAARHSNKCYPTIGLHPTSVNANYERELHFVKQQLEANSFVAIGEIGIDCYWSLEFIEQQRYVFREQLKLTIKYGLPIIIHSRNSFEEIFAIIQKFKGQLKGIFHSFSGTIEDYHTIKSLGDFKIGIGGVLTFKNSNLPELVKQIPINDIVLETDSPYLAPVPYRGKRNESAYVSIVAQKLSEVKGLDLAEVIDRTTKNALAVFRLKQS